MNAANFWQLFLETGAPEMYLLHKQAKMMEETHVLDDTGTGSAGNSLQ